MTTKNELLKARLLSDKKRFQEQFELLKASKPTENRREGSPFGKREEEAAETSELENRLAMEKRILDQLADTDYALGKFDKGTYGLCEKCGQAINPERLEALPQAKLCLKCKAEQANHAH